MNWNTIYNTRTKEFEKYARRSECGQYQISKASIRGVWKYTLWSRGKKMKRLGIYDSFEDASRAI